MKDQDESLDPKPNLEIESINWSISNIIRLLREIAFLLVLVYLAFSFINGNTSISFGTKELTASEIISILLAFFAILLSAAFYYMSTQQSNLFYHNIHQFTKDTSEILGRLDEQVKNIGGKQTELKDTFEKNYTYNKQNGISQQKEEKINKDLEEKEIDIKKKERNFNQKVDELIEKIESEEEKEKLKAELTAERDEIKKLKSEMEEKSNLLHLMSKVKLNTRRLMARFDTNEIDSYSPTDIFMKLTGGRDTQYKNDLISLGYIEIINGELKATRSGSYFLREVRNEIMHERDNK